MCFSGPAERMGQHDRVPLCCGKCATTEQIHQSQVSTLLYPLFRCNTVMVSLSACVQGATFSLGACGQGATFSLGAWVQGATFSLGAWVQGATFSLGACVQGATFSLSTCVQGATFSLGTCVQGATWGPHKGSPEPLVCRLIIINAFLMCRIPVLTCIHFKKSTIWWQNVYRLDITTLDVWA